VTVPKTLAEYCVTSKPAQRTASDLTEFDFYDDDDFEDGEDDDYVGEYDDDNDEEDSGHGDL